MWGADVEQLDALGTRMAVAADVLDRIRVELSGQLRHAPWQGGSADRFRHDWTARHMHVLLGATASLREAGRRLRSNAAEQREASGAHGGAGSHRGGLPPGAGLNPWGVLTTGLEALSDALNAEGVVLTIASFATQIGILSAALPLDDLGASWRMLADAAKTMEETPLGRIEAKVGWLAVGVDTALFVDVLATGTTDQKINAGVELGWSVAAAFIPPVALVKGAWDVGTFIGEQIGPVVAEHFHFQDGFIDAVIRDRYGTELSPVEREEMLHRYDVGTMGIVHLGQDLALEGGNFLRKLIH
jgi:hypothetical protein